MKILGMVKKSSNQKVWDSMLRNLMAAGFIMCVLSSVEQVMGTSGQPLVRGKDIDQMPLTQNDTNQSASAYIEIFKRGMVDLVENMQADEKTIATYVSPKYVQSVNGKKIDYQGFIRHMALQKQHIKSAKVKFIQVIAMNNVVSSIHEATVTKKDGSTSVIKVIGHMTYEGNKLIGVDELSLVVQGDSQDNKLSSIN